VKKCKSCINKETAELVWNCIICLKEDYFYKGKHSGEIINKYNNFPDFTVIDIEKK
jgi:hypothetical protein